MTIDVKKIIVYVFILLCLVFISTQLACINILVLALMLFEILFLVSHIYKWLVQMKEKQSDLVKIHLNANIVVLA